MRKALIGIIMAATVLSPVAAQAESTDRSERIQQRYQRQGERNQARSEARQQRQAVRQQRVEAPRRPDVQRPQSDGASQNRRAWQNQGSSGQQGYRNRVANQGGQAGGNWGGGRGEDREALRNRIQETREASRRSAEGLNGHYQRQAARNQARTEERLRRDYREDRRDRRDDRREWRDDRREWRDDRRDDRRDWRQSRNWDRQWRNDRRYDWQRYRYSNRNLFHIGRYYSPYRNHRYSRLSIGFTLGSGFYGDNYWIQDPWEYRLPPAYPGTRWVRYYDDVLLVDVYTGEVVDVIHDFFW